MATPQIICLTPVKNESWILERFLACASVWADHIIIADQGSTDGSRDIAAKFPKVTLIENKAKGFNEPERQKMLIEAARKIEGPRLLVALDADEFFTADFLASEDWAQAKTLAPGTVLEFNWACMRPDCKTWYAYPGQFPLGFVDDGTPHEGKAIHSPRIPIPPDAPRVTFGPRVMHFSVIDWDRFQSKTRWYQCWEFLNQKWQNRLQELFWFYHRDVVIPPEIIHDIPAEWIDGYDPSIDLMKFEKRDHYPWDREVLGFFEKHGTRYFSKLDIWDVDWNKIHEAIHGTPPAEPILDPRSGFEKGVHRWMTANLKYENHLARKRPLPKRLFNAVARRVLRKLGW